MSSEVPPATPGDVPARIAAVHDAAFREVTGKWREYRGLVRTPAGGTFFPSEVSALASALPALGLRGAVLEVGSGDGRVLSLLAHLRRGPLAGLAAATGVEIVPEYLEASRLARARLAPLIDYGCVAEIPGDAFALELAPYDALLWFLGGAMPGGQEAAFAAKAGRELRPGARLVAWGPDAASLDLPRLGELPVPGYHTLHVYAGQAGGGG